MHTRTLVCPVNASTAVAVPPTCVAGRRGGWAVAAAGAVGPITDVPKAFKKLQNGSDMRGVALEGAPCGLASRVLCKSRGYCAGRQKGRGLIPPWLHAGVPGQDVNLTEGKAFYVGLAFAEWLEENAVVNVEETGLTVGVSPSPHTNLPSPALPYPGCIVCAGAGIGDAYITSGLARSLLVLCTPQ